MKNLKSLILLGVATGAVVLLGLGYYWLLADRPIAVVGDYKITKKDATLRNKVSHVFYPADPSDHGLEQLINAYTAATIMKNIGFEITSKQLAEEDERINNGTRDPGNLARIKDIFGSDKEAYLRVFILPTLAERSIYGEIFLRNTKIQAPALEKVAAFMESARLSSFEKAALAAGLKIQGLSISLNDGFEWESSQEAEEESLPGKRPRRRPRNGRSQDRDIKEVRTWIDEILAHMQPGEMFGQPVNFGEQWLAVKFIGPDRRAKAKYNLLTVAFPKLNYQEWLEAEKAKITIKKY
jgi:hypothetical protein